MRAGGTTRATLALVLLALLSLPRNWPDRRPPGPDSSGGGKSVWCDKCQANRKPRRGKCPGCGKRL